MPIPFAPSAFTLEHHTFSDPTPQHPSQVCTGFIPAGVYISGSWRLRGSRSFSSAGAATFAEHLSAGDALDTYASGNLGGAYDVTFTVSAAMLEEINAAAGTVFSVTVSTDIFGTARLEDDVNLFTLDLVPPAACTYALIPTGAHYGSAGGSGTFEVVTDGGCAWSALENDPDWLHVTGGSSGSGAGTVSYTVDANPAPSSARVGTIAVATETFTVTQDGAAGDGTGGTSTNFGHPFPHNQGHHLFMTIGFPNGYEPGLDVYALYPGMDELQFISVRPRSGYIGRVTNRILTLYDTAGAEIGAGTMCGPVDIWRFRIA